MAEESNGVWRTIRGRRVFIREGESLLEAMQKSGKFNNLGRSEYQQAKAEYTKQNNNRAISAIKHNKMNKEESYWKNLDINSVGTYGTGTYVQFQDGLKYNHEDIMKYPNVSPRASSNTWARVWEDKENTLNIEDSKYGARKQVLDYLKKKNASANEKLDMYKNSKEYNGDTSDIDSKHKIKEQKVKVNDGNTGETYYVNRDKNPWEKRKEELLSGKNKQEEEVRQAIREYKEGKITGYYGDEDVKKEIAIETNMSKEDVERIYNDEMYGKKDNNKYEYKDGMMTIKDKEGNELTSYGLSKENYDENPDYWKARAKQEYKEELYWLNKEIENDPYMKQAGEFNSDYLMKEKGMTDKQVMDMDVKEWEKQFNEWKKNRKTGMNKQEETKAIIDKYKKGKAKEVSEDYSKVNEETTISFGKVDGYGNGRKSNEAKINMKLKDGVFTASGEIWNNKGTDIISGGQNLDEMKEYFKGNKDFETIHSMWKKYHLNDMHAGTVKQEEALEKKFGGVNASKYDEQVNYLKSIGLYEDEGYKFGTGWLKRDIPEADLKTIVALIRKYNKK